MVLTMKKWIALAKYARCLRKPNVDLFKNITLNELEHLEVIY